jgi:hypothetical protein
MRGTSGIATPQPSARGASGGKPLISPDAVSTQCVGVSITSPQNGTSSAHTGQRKMVDSACGVNEGASTAISGREERGQCVSPIRASDGGTTNAHWSGCDTNTRQRQAGGHRESDYVSGDRGEPGVASEAAGCPAPVEHFASNSSILARTHGSFSP